MLATAPSESAPPEESEPPIPEPGPDDPELSASAEPPVSDAAWKAVEGKQVELREGHAVFVAAGAEHRFVGYENLTVLVIFDRQPR